MTPEGDHLSKAVLDALRMGMRLEIHASLVERPGVGEVWLILARDERGGQWTSEHEDHYTAACMLADLVGFELDDG